MAAELNAAAGRERPVRYQRTIPREVGDSAPDMRAYWGWDKFITLGSDG